MSLALNLNPFMRFDGYYILSDLAGIENLQPRAFEIGRWRLRELLLGLGRPPPERLAPSTLRWLAIYAWMTWIYRFFLFIAIALIVYQIGFKLLGIALFVIEIVYFIAWPIWAELKEWHRMRASIVKARRGLMVGMAALAAIGLAFVPLSTTVLVPATIEDRGLVQLFPARAAVVVERAAQQGDRIEAGGLILALASPALEHEIQQTGLRHDLVQRRLARTPGDRVDRTSLLVLEQSLASLAAKLDGLQRERAELRLAAPSAGTIVEMAPELKPGRWLGRSDLVARLASGDGCIVRGYVDEDDVARIDLGARARLVPEIATAGGVEVELEHVAAVGSGAMDLVELASHYGGAVSARSINRPGEPRAFVPVVGQFLVSGRVIIDGGNCQLAQAGRGTLHVAGKPESLAARLWRRVLKIAIRESGL